MSLAHKSLALHIDVERFPLKEPFRITGHTMVHTDVVKVTLERDGVPAGRRSLGRLLPRR